MSNILDYLAWRGDLSLTSDPFNSIDAVILSCLSYVDFAGVVPGKGNGRITIKDATKKFFKLHSESELAKDKAFINFGPQLLKALAASERFQDAYLLNYVDDTDIEREIQFAAIEIDTSDGTPFISYRGTDDRIIGWKEDFNLSYMTVPAEIEAVLYLQDVMSGRKENFRLGGHSKGGHLAIYAASKATQDLAERAVNIYSFDGPGFGFNRDILNSTQFKKIQPRIEKFIPQTSVVGRLLTRTVAPVIVKSTELGIMQHNPMSWELCGKNFVTLASTDKISDVVEETMTSWIEEMSLEERKVFVDELFSVFEASGCDTLSAMTKIRVKEMRAIVKRMRLIKNDSGEKVRTLVKIFFMNLNALNEGTIDLLEEETKLRSLVANIKNKTGK